MTAHNNVTTRVPVICTRGIVVFPGLDVMIEVGRQKSINAVNEASANYDGMVWVVCQNDIMVDNPVKENLYDMGTLSKIKIVQWIAKVYISIMRGTPLMLQIIVVYFAPYYVFRIRVGSGYRFPAVILAFVINYAAYFAEIYRAGIESMPVGQYEAAEVLGYSKAQTFARIILPQVIKRVLPPITNETITLVKDTSMAFTISIAEMFTIAKQIGAAQTSIMPLLAAGVFYYVFNLVVATGMEYLENCHLDKQTYNKALQKIRESFRVSKKIKEQTKKMKK